MANQKEECSLEKMIKYHQLLTEMNKREEKYWRIVEHFNPRLTLSYVSPKFYSRHQVEEDVEVVERFKRAIEDKIGRGPQQKWDEPVLSSHVYGWYSHPLIHIDRSDRRLHVPVRFTDHTKHHVLLKNLDRTLKGAEKHGPPT